MRLHAVGGLCNRLRAILSAAAVKPSLTVVWEPDEYVSGGRFEDAFRSLHGVTFVESGPWDVEAFAPMWGPPDWRMLILNERAIDAVARSTPNVPYLAIHVRRTDHSPLARERRQFTDDEAFIRWCRQWSTTMPLYLATDNLETRQRLRRSIESDGREVLCAGVLRGAEEQAHDDHRRWSSMMDAVVDLSVCAWSHRFLGSGYSSFSETIQAMRELRR